jgi:hypothetical protein
VCSSDLDTYQIVTLAAAEDADTADGQTTTACWVDGLGTLNVTKGGTVTVVKGGVPGNATLTAAGLPRNGPGAGGEGPCAARG